MSNSSRKKILILIDWYLPGYKAGGPIQSVANIIGHLKNDFDFSVITSDTDLHESKPYPNIKSNIWNTLKDGTRVFYFSKEQQTFSKLKKIILAEQADALYINSLFSVFFTIYPLYIRKKFLVGRKTILAPRGMLGKGALNIKPFKKKLFLFTAKVYGLYRNIKWHASSLLEADEIKKEFGKNQTIATALNLTAPRSLTFVPRKKYTGSVRFVFLSRIAIKKNILLALQLLKKLNSSQKVVFDIYGPVDENAYWEECLGVIKTLPPNIAVQYKGAIANDKVNTTLQTYHFSILLTFNENFGHSIIESLATGCPVLLSDQTPWRDLTVQKAGWDISLNEENKILEAMNYCCQMEQQEFDEWSNASMNYAHAVINNPEASLQNKKLFA